VSRADVTLDT